MNTYMYILVNVDVYNLEIFICELACSKTLWNKMIL